MLQAERGDTDEILGEMMLGEMIQVERRPETMCNFGTRSYLVDHGEAWDVGVGKSNKRRGE